LTPDKLSKAQILQLSAVKENGETFDVFIHPTVQIQNDATKYLGIIKGQDGCLYKLAPGAFENPSEENNLVTIALNFFCYWRSRDRIQIFLFSS
jgi:hypothetical protein